LCSVRCRTVRAERAGLSKRDRPTRLGRDSPGRSRRNIRGTVPRTPSVLGEHNGAIRAYGWETYDANNPSLVLTSLYMELCLNLFWAILD
jgi:hypothetical protein